MTKPTVRIHPIARTTKCLAFLAVSALAGPSFAAESPWDTVLSLAGGPRAQSLGGARLTYRQDASAVSANPAALGREASEVFFHQAKFDFDLAYTYAAYSLPVKTAALGVSAARFDQGTLDGRDESGKPTGDFRGSDTVFSLAYSKPLGAGLSVGLAGSSLVSRLGSHEARAYALDISTLYDWGAKTRLAAGVFHLGKGAKFGSQQEPLPTSVDLGISHKLLPFLTVVGEGRLPLQESRGSLSIGAEWTVGNTAALRAGFLSSAIDGNSRPSGAGINAGLGLTLFKRARLDYAISPMGELGAAHHISLAWRFN